MFRLRWLSVSSLALLFNTVVTAEQPTRQTRFEPNYIAVEDGRLTSTDGRSGQVLRKGTAVVARPDKGNRFRVETRDGLSGIVEGKSLSRLGSSIRVTGEAKQVSDSSNQFAFDLYLQIRKQQGNLFFSPASISTALAMTYGGAAGQTKQEMMSVLHFGQSQDVHQGYGRFLELLNSTGDQNGYSLATANRLWGAQGYPFEQAFLQLTRDQYRAELESLNFGQPEQARQTINGWVQEQTRDKIADLIPPGILNPDTRLVLVNAIYFQGGWESEFEKAATKQAPFHLNATNKIDVPMMQQTEEFGYAEDPDVQILSMPYRGNELSMVVILPKEIDGLSRVESTLTADRFIQWIGSLRSDRPVETYLPKFKTQSTFMLSTVLKAMGMASAFSDRANFSGISKSEELMISEAIHQAVVDVDEKGTEAAAATAVVIAPTSLPFEPQEPPKPVIFRADHPFLFMIRENRTGAMLFMGRTRDPLATRD